jgi:peptidoglycan/LPS O-acetylase OafA/YrhL
MKYSSHIDGLRAVAIVLVIFYHTGLALFPSGFIGVDVFFVISGFLITSIIYESLNGNNFSFIDFYNRRLWRLQPIFICCLVVCSVFTIIFLLPDDLIFFSRSIRKASLFMSNIFFNRNATGYFAPNIQQIPLLHTWSLSLEWQCYLIFPFIMYGLHRQFKRHLRSVVYLLMVCFFILTLYYSNNIPTKTYYQFSSRIFEFLIGACIALTSKMNFRIPPFVVNILGFLALMAIIYCAHLSDILYGYPNWYALGVCVATGLLIAIGRSYPSLYCIKIISFKPLVFIGLISYSLYLWHWPIFAFLRYQSIAETPFVIGVALGITVCIAFLSWRYIEKPARRFNRIKFSYTVASLVIVPILFVHIVSYLIKANDGFPQRYAQEFVKVYQAMNKYASDQRSKCINDHVTAIDHKCTVGSKEANHKTGFLIGDSFSNHYWGFMDVIGRDANVSILAQSVSSCLTLPDIYLFNWSDYKNKTYQACREQTEEYYRMIQQNHYDYVFLGEIWINYYSSESIINKLGDERSSALSEARFVVALEKGIQQIIASGARPVIIGSNAIMPPNFHKCFFKYIKEDKPYDPNECSFDLVLSEANKRLNLLFERMQNKYPQLIFIDPIKVQCINGHCNVGINGVPVYRDVGHITDYASYQFGELYLKQFSNPLVNV